MESMTMNKLDKKEKEDEKGDDLVVPETKFEGSIGWRVYANLFSFSSMGASAFVVFMLFNLIATLFQLAPSYIISAWSNLPYAEQQEQDIWPKLFIGSVVGLMLFGFLRAAVFVCALQQAATNMHNKMAEKVMRSNILFFDSNPIGRILTRFSKDMIILDIMIAGYTVFTFANIFRIISVFITVAIINPYLFIVLGIGIIVIVKIT